MTLARLDDVRPEGGSALAVAETPKEIVKRAQQMADALMDIVRKKHLAKNIGGKDFLPVEAWQTIGRFDRATPVTEWVRYAEVAGYKGFEARIKIVRDGEEIGAAESFCGLDEFVTQGQKGAAKLNAAKSMAQTRATSKALRQCYSFIAVLAGYQPTPSEEMPHDQPAEATEVAEKGYCPTHRLAFKHVPAGTSKAGKAYAAFWACTERGCREKPAGEAPAKPQDLLLAEFMAVTGQLGWTDEQRRNFLGRKWAELSADEKREAVEAAKAKVGLADAPASDEEVL